MVETNTAAQSKTIVLLKPLGSPNNPKSYLERVTLRPPRFADFMELGEPEIYVPVAEGRGGFVETNLEAVRRYVERLAGKDLDPGLLEHASLEDSMRLRDAVLGFFRDARQRIASANTPGSLTPDGSASTIQSPSAA